MERCRTRGGGSLLQDCHESNVGSPETADWLLPRTRANRPRPLHPLHPLHPLLVLFHTYVLLSSTFTPLALSILDHASQAAREADRLPGHEVHKSRRLCPTCPFGRQVLRYLIFHDDCCSQGSQFDDKPTQHQHQQQGRVSER